MHSSFWVFCAAEIGIKEGYARQLMRIAENFSMEQVEQFGVTRLAVSLSVPACRRGLFLEQSKKLSARGPELRELAQDVRATEPESAVLNQNPQGMDELSIDKHKADEHPTDEHQLDEHSSNTSVRPPEESQEDYGPFGRTVLTGESTQITLPIGVQVLPLWRRPTSLLRVGEVTKYAQNLTEQPWTSMRLADDVIQFLRLIQGTDGNLQIVVETRKGKLLDRKGWNHAK